METKPLVSIICTVYNKGPWIAQAIESFLSQQTTFAVEILLVDDASSDQSPQILADYAERYPDKIRSFYNESNQGISKTWVRICQEAQGDYIARCDGDDFWLDPLKLQKQIEALEQNPQSRWSNCDFDVYNQDGVLKAQAGFEKDVIPLADTYEKMLATRGFTMASTWLIERELMLEVNTELDLTTSDDTFNLQMDLFQRTELTYLPEPMVAYRINEGSDSRPKDFDALTYRFNRLLDTQLDYVEKYPQSDFKEMTKILLRRNNDYELELSKPITSVSQIGSQTVTIYFAAADGVFSQEDILRKTLEAEDTITFKLSPDVTRIRIDLSEIPSFYSKVALIDKEHNTEILPYDLNGFQFQNDYFFPQPDPQLFYEIKDYHGKELTLHYQMMNVDDVTKLNYIGDVLGRKLLELGPKAEELTIYKVQCEHLQQRNQELQAQLEEMVVRYNSVTHSRRWTIPSKFINLFRKRK
ncbi:glycosyltransferase family 2 protein [Streptococcus oricebi]|uniref:Glycosyl transferase n=1 Tax=Streptococcus oricebi TaxID=1547447 RepID=A0ABS5B0Y1_9STRE|nr:glycosyltransferase family 2 protein [Streptococcus oricebi]MBP2622485.1 glycosyl transferase [Streptococcus oricebi]